MISCPHSSVIPQVMISVTKVANLTNLATLKNPFMLLNPMTTVSLTNSLETGRDFSIHFPDLFAVKAVKKEGIVKVIKFSLLNGEGFLLLKILKNQKNIFPKSL